MTADFGKAFSFPFKDGKWIFKLIIGGALCYIPVVNFIVFGYLFKVLADAAQKKEPVLPEWADWGVLFQDGFIAFVVMVCFSFLFIPLWITGLIPVIGHVFRLAGFLLLPPVVALSLCLYAGRRDMGSAFDFKAILEKFRAGVSDYLVIALVTGVLMSISILTLILMPFLWFYILLVSYRLYGEVFSASV